MAATVPTPLPSPFTIVVAAQCAVSDAWRNTMTKRLAPCECMFHTAVIHYKPLDDRNLSFTKHRQGAKMQSACTGCRDGGDFEIPFTMAFQPIVDTETSAVFAFEALVRGKDGGGAADVLSTVNEANRYAFDQACRVKAITLAMDAGLLSSGACLSINFLPNAVYSPKACIQLTLQTAREVGMPLDRLIFEFTETEAMGSPEHVSSIIETYKRIGFRIAIDDFGSGHSGLNMFARFVPDEIKLDMDLVRGVDTDARRQAIVKGVVSMCRDLDTLVIAEGIETRGEAMTLRDLGVRYQQGYWYARPGLEHLPAIPADRYG